MEMEPTSATDTDTNFNVYVGSETGVLKGIYFGNEAPRLKNFHSFEEFQDVEPISSLSWIDSSQKEILVSFKTGTVKIYNTKLRYFTSGFDLPSEFGTIIGVNIHDSSYLIGHENGMVNLYDFEDGKNKVEINTGNHLSKLRQHSSNKSIFATGGKENDLKIWNLEAPDPKVPIFKAKNLPDDFLCLRIPVWVQDLTFMPESTELVALCTRYGHVRLYDTKIDNKNRPVVNEEFMDHPLMSISTTKNNRQVLVGSSQGKMGLIDLRNYGKGKVVHQFGGFSGSIRSISAHPDLPYFVSGGLDRHLYLHHIDQKKPLKKLYLKSKLNSVLICDSFNYELSESESNKTPDEELVPAGPVWQNISSKVLQTDKGYFHPKKKLKTSK